MPIPVLDKETAKAVNELTQTDIGTNSAFDHEILWYGINSVVHAYIMVQARDVYSGKVSLDDFVQKYSIDAVRESPGYTFNGVYTPPHTVHGIFVPLRNIESAGVFVPRQAYWTPDRKIKMFDGDYLNWVNDPSWTADKGYAYDLLKRCGREIWTPSIFEDQAIVEVGLRFGRDMWRTCTVVFEKRQADKEQSQKVAELGRKLIAYYSAVVSEQD